MIAAQVKCQKPGCPFRHWWRVDGIDTAGNFDLSTHRGPRIIEYATKPGSEIVQFHDTAQGGVESSTLDGRTRRGKHHK